MSTRLSMAALLASSLVLAMGTRAAAQIPDPAPPAKLELAAPPEDRPLGLVDVAQIARAGASDSTIIDRIRKSGSVFQLTADQITWLQQVGVSERVIIEMVNRRPPRQPAKKDVQIPGGA